ncbi:MAG: hypothetical protein PHH28_10350 [Desulfuromonadaceae bacterium]|nr:hypothetical protein [Desulfuromonadaceae bacterium]
MNELLLQQILDTKPRVNHSTGVHAREIEPLYLACLYIDPSVADIEIDDNATTGDVFRLLIDILRKHEVTVNHEKGSNGVEIEFTYQIIIENQIIELDKLLGIKKNSVLAYNAIISCVVLLSHYCQNFLEYHDVIRDQIGDRDDGDVYEYESHIECNELMDSYKEIENDYFEKMKLGDENILHEINCIQANIESHEHYNDKIIELIKLILDNFNNWKEFDKAESDSGDCYEDDSINFSMFNCFVLTLENECYTDWLNDHYQYHWENGYVNDKFIYMNRNIDKIYFLKKAHSAFIDALAIVNDIITDGEL